MTIDDLLLGLYGLGTIVPLITVFASICGQRRVR